MHIPEMSPYIDFGSFTGNSSPTMNMDLDHDKIMPIAIVGMSAKLPGEAENLEKFWSMCAAGRDAWSPIPKDRWNQEAFHHPDASRNGAVSHCTSTPGIRF
jgi:hypothetical protein